VGAASASLAPTAPTRARLTATPDFYLPSGATSREVVRAGFETIGGPTLMSAYEVLDTTRIEPGD